MDNYRQEIFENLDNYLIGLDDTFSFKCRGCGKCCKNRNDILLNTRDLYNIAKKLGLTMVQTIETYCDTYIGDSSRMPLVRLKPQGVNDVCPLLKGDQCRVHDSKPGVCALYPLGRAIMFDETEAEPQEERPMQIRYIKNPIYCSISRKQTVRNWLERFNIPIDDQFYIEWSKTFRSLSLIMQSFDEKGIIEKSLSHIWDAIYSALYTRYDTDNELEPQFIENAEKIIDVLSIIKSELPKLTDGI